MTTKDRLRPMVGISTDHSSLFPCPTVRLSRHKSSYLVTLRSSDSPQTFTEPYLSKGCTLFWGLVFLGWLTLDPSAGHMFSKIYIGFTDNRPKNSTWVDFTKQLPFNIKVVR